MGGVMMVVVVLEERTCIMVKTEPALVSVSDSYSEDEIILVCDSEPSSSPTYTITGYFIYQLLP